jgi:hypothetical protein
VHLRDIDNPEEIELLREGELEREAGADLLAHIKARAEAEEARTKHLLELLARAVEPEHTDNPNEEVA